MQEMAQDGFWKQADIVSSALVHLSILIGAVAAAIKFRMLNILSHRYKSELDCRQHVLSDNRIVFEANYTVTNNGGRPIDLTEVQIRLCSAKLKDGLLWADQESVIVERLIKPDVPNKGGNCHIEAGERSIFTLRTILKGLEPVTFVVCQLSWRHKRQPGPYIGMHVRDQGVDAQTGMSQTAGTGR